MTEKPELDLTRFPRLAALLHGTEESELKAEVEALLGQRLAPRAMRFRVQVLAKLLREVHGETLEESVVLRDISESGMRVTIPSHLEPGLFESCAAHFRLRVGNGEDARSAVVHATFIRLAELGQNGANIAYRFDALSDEARAVLAEICASARTRSLSPPSRKAPRR